MRKISILAIGLLSITLLLSECKTSKSTTKTTTKEEKSPAPNPDMADITAGQVLFTTRCDKCHRQPGARKHDDAGWKITMGNMGPKAGLTDAETAQVLKYLASADK